MGAVIEAVDEAVSLREFARREGVSHSFLVKMKADGRLVTVEKGGKTLIQVEASRKLLAETRDPKFDGAREVNAANRAAKVAKAASKVPKPQQEVPNTPSAPPPLSDYHRAKTQRAVLDAQEAQLDFEERAGRLVDLETVRHRLQARIGALREALRQIPGRLAPLVAIESDPVRVQQMLRTELDRVLLDQAGGL